MTILSTLAIQTLKTCRRRKLHFIRIVLLVLLVFSMYNTLFRFPLQEQGIAAESSSEKQSLLPTTVASTTTTSQTNTGSTVSQTRVTNPVLTAANNTTDPSINRTLVILAGNLRCGEPAWQSLYKNLLDINSADLGLIGAGKKGHNSRYPNASLFERAKYVWEAPEYEEWADALDLINGTSWRTRVLPQISNYSLQKGLLGGIFGTPSSGAIQGMMKWWLSQYMQNDASINQYDTFILTRTDQYYGCPLDLKTALRRRQDVSIPRGEDYSGVCDRFMVIDGKDNLLKALDVLPPFLNDYDPSLYGKLHNPEGLLKATFKRKKLAVQRISRFMFTCAAPDGRDPTRWRTTTAGDTNNNPNDLPPGKMVARREYGVDFKYKNEFSLTRYQCVRKPKEFRGF